MHSFLRAGLSCLLTALAVNAQAFVRLDPVYRSSTQRRMEAYNPSGPMARRELREEVNGQFELVSTTRWIVDGWRPVKQIEEVGGDTIERVYTWGLDLAGWNDRRSLEESGGIGGLLAVREKVNAGAETTYYVLGDPMGNVVALATSDGTLVAEYDYDPYGRLLRETGAKAAACAFRYSTKYRDPDLDLYCYGHRWYDPASIKWLTPDPIGERGGVNLTAFCNGDPINKVDPLGLDAIDLHADVDPETGLISLGVYYINERALWWDAAPEKVGTLDLESGMVLFGGDRGVRQTSLALMEKESDRWGTDWVKFYDSKTVGLTSSETIEGSLGFAKSMAYQAQLAGELGVSDGLTPERLTDIAVSSKMMQDLAWEAVIFEVTAPAEVLTVASRCRTVNYSRSLRPRGHWKKAAFARGYALEPALGANLPYGFRTIDRWHKASGVATSIKTLDVTGKTYTKAGGVFNQLRGYIDTLSGFQGGRRGNVLIRNRDITSRVLRVGIEPGKMSTKQYMEVLRAYNYGKQINVPVHLQLVPTTM